MTDELFGDRLRFLRNERGISAREMSIALGQNESYINKIETAQRSVPMTSFFKICDFLNVSPADFFDERVRNTSHTTQELVERFKKLTPRQSAHVYEIVKDLTGGA